MSTSSFPHATAAAAGGALGVDAQANGDTNSNFGAPCYVGPRFDTDGSEHELSANGAPGSSVNTWLTGGSSSSVWVEFTRTGGTETKFTNKSNATRYNINVNQEFHLLDSSSAGVAITVTGYFRFYDAATGGNLLDQTASATWSARMRDPI